MKGNKKIVGILLAGGLSRRYGSPKAFAEINGSKFYEISYGILANVCDEVIIVTREEFIDCFPKEYHVTVDREPFIGYGPLAGIYSAMEAVSADYYVVLPCDMPLMTEAVMEQLIGMHEKEITVVESEGYVQALVSVWSERVKPKIKTALLNNRLKMTNVLNECQTVKVDGKKLSNSSAVFMNVNTPDNDEELRKWKRS